MQPGPPSLTPEGLPIVSSSFAGYGTPSAVLPRVRGRWGALRAVLLAVFVFCTSLAVIVASPSTANAYAAPPKPVEFGPVIKKPPTTEVIKGAASMNPWVRAARVLWTGYQVYDAYQAYQSGKEANAAMPPGSADGVNSVCNFTGTVKAEGGNLVGSVSGLCNYYQSTNLTVNTDHSGNYCVSAAGVVSTMVTARGGTGAAITNTSVGNNMFQINGTVTRPVCPEGSTIGQARAYIDFNNGTGAMTEVGSGYPAAAHESKTTVKCRKPDGTFITITDTERGHPERLAIPSCWDRVGGDPWDVTVEGGPVGIPPKKHVEVTTDPNILTKYPDCFANGALDCVVTVWINGQPCTATRTICHDWQSATTTDPTTKVQCRFGTYVIALADCDELKKSFDPDTGTQVVTGTGPDGEAETAPKSGTGGSSSGFPSTGVNPIIPRVTPDENTDPDSASCFAEAWSWNPVDWVYVPVKCAFLWAVKPKVAFQTRVQTIKDAASTKAPFSFIAGFGGIPATLGDMGQNCPDWRIKVGPTDENVVCNSSFTAAIRDGRPIFAGMMVLLAVWPILRSIGYASFPLIKPVPTR